MALTIKELLETKGVHPSAEHLKILEQKWQETLELRGELSGIDLNEADISLLNIAGGDHHE